MEPREGMNPGVTVIGAEDPSTYHVAPRSENPTRSENAPQFTEAPAVDASPVSVGMSGPPAKKKRGRPRKYGPDGALSPTPISSSAPPAGNSSSGRRGRGRLSGSADNRAPRVPTEISPRISAEILADWEGEPPLWAHFLPHVINVEAGEDVTMKVISFSQRGRRAICIMSAIGSISNAAIRRDCSGGTVTYEGRFEILALTGAFLPTENQGDRSRVGGLSICMVAPDGRVIGGGVAGLLIAASVVQIVVGSFLPAALPQPRPKKEKAEATPTLAAEAPTGPDAVPTNVGEGNLCGNIEQNSNAMNQNLSSSPTFPHDTWSTMQEARNLATDINISLPDN